MSEEDHWTDFKPSVRVAGTSGVVVVVVVVIFCSQSIGLKGELCGGAKL